ncbi:choline transport protein [Cadophora sp. MPI-SDFR-AT-0126]|nr:choline transport protein [Leotiomycetes sp. MPI-SDFR-AT-0126]
MTNTLTNHGSSSGAHLQRNMGKINMVAMTFAILNTWIALAGVMGTVLGAGGPVAFVYGFIFCVLCNVCITASLGELASIWPTAGGQYHYSYMLGNEKWKRIWSFTVGWLSIVGWLTLVTTATYFAAFFITAAIIVATNGTYESAPWKVYLIFVAIIVFTTVSNLYGNKIMCHWNNAAMMWSLPCFGNISVTLLAISKKTDATYVFTGFSNSTGWPSGISWILGMGQSALSLIGSDAATHMSEEMSRPTRDTAKAMVYSIVVGGITGLGFILVILFCLNDPETVLATATGMPITEMIYQSTGSAAAAAILTLMLGICFINGTNAAVTTVSRLLFAMARDQGTVASEYFSRIDPKFKVPSRTIIVCCIFNLCFGLLYLGPAVAFNAYVYCTTLFLNISYGAPILMLVVGGRKAVSEQVVDFKIGHLGPLLNMISVIFIAIASIIPATSNNMNFVSAVIGIAALFIVVTWMITRKEYDGPDVSILEGLRSVDSAPQVMGKS